MIRDIFLGSIKDRKIESAIGMSYRKFGDLVPVFAASYEMAQQERIATSEVARIRDGDTSGALDSPEKCLFFILYYLRSIPSFDKLGALFDLSPSHAYDHMIRCVQVLRRGLEILAISPHRTLDSADELRQALERFAEASNDDAEAELARPACDEPNDGRYGGRRTPTARDPFADADYWRRSPAVAGASRARRAS